MSEQITQTPQQQSNTETELSDSASVSTNYGELSPFARSGMDATQRAEDDKEQAKWNQFATGEEQSQAQSPTDASAKP